MNENGKKLARLYAIAKTISTANPRLVDQLIMNEVGPYVAHWMAAHSASVLVNEPYAAPGLVMMGYLLAKLEASPELLANLRASGDPTIFMQTEASA